MEESEKRRERLRAMRMEAAQVDAAAGNGDEPALPSHLSNPLIESSVTTLSQAEARFDFYTDPMAAFSSSNRKSNDMPTSQIPNCAGTSNPESTPRAPQFQRDHLQGPSHSCSSVPYGSPVRTSRPLPMNQTTPMVGQWYHPPPTPGSGWNGNSMHGRAPPLGPSPLLGRGNWCGIHTSLNEGVGRGSTFGRAPPPSHSPFPRSFYPGSPNPSPRPGRGRGNWSGPCTSTGSGRWASSHGHGSEIGKSSRAEGFYHTSMLEDPWKMLEPVLWKKVGHSSKFRDLEAKSLATKRPRASESWSQSSSQPSLAEYLAAAIKEAVEVEPSS